MKVINTIEALIGLFGAAWFFFYYMGWLNFKGDKEERRRKVEKYGFLFLICSFMCLLGSAAIIVGTFFEF